MVLLRVGRQAGPVAGYSSRPATAQQFWKTLAYVHRGIAPILLVLANPPMSFLISPCDIFLLLCSAGSGNWLRAAACGGPG
jgi:predicted membrane metal-binding protein